MSLQLWYEIGMNYKPSLFDAAPTSITVNNAYLCVRTVQSPLLHREFSDAVRWRPSTLNASESDASLDLNALDVCEHVVDRCYAPHVKPSRISLRSLHCPLFSSNFKPVAFWSFQLVGISDLRTPSESVRNVGEDFHSSGQSWIESRWSICRQSFRGSRWRY